MADRVPDVVVSRLPIYLRALSRLDAEGQRITSSKELAAILGTSAAQVRKDLSHFGRFGKQGTGYHIPYLIRELGRILQVDRVWDVVLVGGGDLTDVVLRSLGTARGGFRITAVFDHDPERIGARIGDVVIQDGRWMKSEIRQRNIKLAIVAVPPEAAQQAAKVLVEAGIRAILSYSPITFKVPEGVLVRTIDPVAQLQHMTYYL